MCLKPFKTLSAKWRICGCWPNTLNCFDDIGWCIYIYTYIYIYIHIYDAKTSTCKYKIHRIKQLCTKCSIKFWFAPNLKQHEKTIVSIISLSSWDNAQLRPRFFQSKKKRFESWLGPCTPVEKKNKPTNRLHGNGTPTIWRCISYWELGFSNIDVMSFFQGLTPDCLGFDREQNSPFPHSPKNFAPITMVFREVRQFKCHQHQLCQEMIWLICEHIPIAYIDRSIEYS